METFANFQNIAMNCSVHGAAMKLSSTLSLSVRRGTGRGFNRIASGKEFDFDEFSIWLEISPAF